MVLLPLALACPDAFSWGDGHMTDSTPGRSVGQTLAGLLRDYGVDTVFGTPGVHNVEMFRDLAETGIRCSLPRHEQGAGFMAGGYARATVKPGDCFVITTARYAPRQQT